MSSSNQAERGMPAADRFAVTISLSIPPDHQENEATVRAAVEDWLREHDWESESMTVSKRRGSW